MAQGDGGSRNGDAPGAVADTGDGTGGTLGTGGAAGGGGAPGAVTDAGDGTGGKLGTGSAAGGTSGGAGGSDEVAEGMSEAGRNPA